MKANMRVLSVGLLATLILVLAFMSVHAQDTVTLTVDLSGSWNRDITVQILTNDGTTVLQSYGNQHGGVRVYNVAPGTYDVKLIQGPKTLVINDLNCSAACDAGDVIADLTVDLGGTWNRDITVQLKTADGDLIWTVGNQHGGVRTYNVLKNTYDLTLVEGPKTLDVGPIDCTGETCDAGDVIAELTVDLGGTWNRDVTVQLKTADGDLIWAVGNQHGGVRTYNVLKNTYDLTLVEGPKTLDVGPIDCTGETCDTGDVVADLTVDLGGTWNRDVTVQLKTETGELIWAVGNQHGALRHYNVLKNTYNLTLVEGAKTLDVGPIVCGGTDVETCDAGDVVADLKVDLGGSWNRDITVELYVNDGAKIWAVGNQHGAERHYNVLKNTYDLKLVQGPKILDVPNIDCTGETCDAGDVIADLTVDLGGTWNRDVTVQLKTETGELIWAVGNQHGALRHYNVLKNTYDLTLVEGPKTLDVPDIDCAGETCEAGDVVADLKVDLGGSWNRDITVELYVNDGAKIWAVGNQHGGERHYNVLKNTYDLKLVQGPKTLDVPDINCTGETCDAGDVIAQLTVSMGGYSGVTTELHLDDSSSCSAGAQIWAVGNQSGAPAYNVLKNTYDVVLKIGGKSYQWDAVDCTGETCILNKSTLTVKFPGISSVHSYVYNSNGVAGTISGSPVASQTYKNDQAVFANLTNGKYDVVLVKNSKTKIVDDVVVLGGCATLDNIVATLTVKFPGISSVHTYVRVDDKVVGTAAGGGVDERTYKNEETSLAVLKNTYDVLVVKNAKQKIIDAVDCNGDTCTVDGIVATLTVKFPGISSVHTYVRVNDGVVGTAAGGGVDERTYKNEETSLAVLKNTYDVLVVKNAKQKIIDAVDCNGDTCTVDGIVATLTVKFPGISSVHTYVKLYDGVEGTVGAAVDERTYKNDETSLAVLKNTYDVLVVKNAKQKIINAVDCNGETCTVDNIVATLTVKFPGISSVHTYVKLNDGAVGTVGAAVDERTYKNNETSLVVLKNTYDVVVVKGAKQKIIDAVDCNGDTCLVDNIVSNFTLHFPGKSNVHVYIKTNDSTANSASGGAVDERTYQANKTTVALLKNTYDLVVNLGGVNYIVDAVDCTSDPAVYSLAIVKLLNSSGGGIAGGQVQYYSGGWKNLGTTPASGALGAAIRGVPASYPFSMNYAFARQEKSQNIGTDLIVVFQTKNVVVELRNDANALIDPGKAQYYAGGWHDIGNTTGGQVSIELLPLTYPFSMDYAFARQEKSQNVGTTPTVTFQTTKVTVELKDSTGAYLNPGTAQYYAGGWRNIGPTVGGQVSIELLPLTYPFSMDYAFARQEKSQNVGTTPTVTFQTTKVTVELKDSTGAYLDTGTAQYYAGGWRNIGPTVGGQVSIELLPLTYPFSMDYAFARQEKSQNVGTTPTVTFQTTKVTVELKDSAGAYLDTGKAQYYAGGWHDIGNTTIGKVSIELLPLTYPFSMDYAFARQEKSQNVGTTATVTFQTGGVQSDSATCTNYYAGGWRAFTQDMELLPGSYPFQFSGGFPQTTYAISGATVNHIH